jgi:hypothetical protein
MARKSKTETATATAPSESKTALMVTLLTRPGGATLEDLTKATGWQPHSIRGALAGTLRRKGYRITSEMSEGVRRYRIGVSE